MGRRWTEEDVLNLKRLARQEPVPNIAQKLDRSVGGVTFKAHTLKLSLKPRKQGDLFDGDPGPAGFDFNGSMTRSWV